MERGTFVALKTRLIFFLAVAFSLFSCDNYNRLLKSSNYELKYEKAKEYYEKENYIRSSALYEDLIPVTKGTDRAEEVYYYYTWSEYYLGDYLLSQYHFKNFTRQYPMSRHVEECYFMNAYCYHLNSPTYSLDQTNTKNAIKEFQSFIDLYPESSRIDTCNKIMDLLMLKLEKKDYEIIQQYYNLSDWKATIVASKNYVKEYPASKYNEEMYYFTINAYYLLAMNSIPSKKQERLDGAIENYVKFVDLYPESSYLSRAENVYKNCLKQKENLNKHGF